MARAPRPRHPEYRDWVRTAVQLVHRAPKPIPLEAAIEAGVAGGALPPAAAAMPLGTAHRLARELGLVACPKRTQRLDADYPMQAIQIDGSSSEHWVVDRILPDGDYVLKLHRAPYPASGYKNKPLGPERLRVLVYAVWDLRTGYTQSRYCVALGENAFDALDFLCWALSGKADPRVPFHGRPEHLWSDQGALFKSAAAHDLLERLDIELVTGAPYAKTRMGGVERSHRTRWQCFERPLFLRAQDTLTLSALNPRLAAFEIAENARCPARVRVGGRTVSRADAWVALTNARPADNRLRKVPADALETLALEARRFVDANGIVRWGGHHYTCERLHSSWVIARRPADGTDTVVVEDETTGARHIATPVTRRAYGTVIGQPATPLDALLKDTPDFKGAELHAPRTAPAGNLTLMPARSVTAAALDNPLDAGHYPTLASALAAFAAIYPYPLSAGHHALVVERIEHAMLAKDAVRELALGLAGLVGADEAAG